MADFFKGLWEKIKEIFSPVIDFYKNLWTAVFDNIKTIGSNIGQVFSALWNNIKKIFSPVANFFGDAFKNAVERIKNVFSSIGSFFQGIWNQVTKIFKNIGQKVGEAISGTFKTAVNAVLSVMENILNTPIRAINGLIGIINKVPGINLGYLNTFNLPRLARGGIIAQPTTAIIGESGKEAVVPLENNTEWIDMLADKLEGRLGGNGQVNVYLDGRLIQRQISKRNTELAFATNR